MIIPCVRRNKNYSFNKLLRFCFCRFLLTSCESLAVGLTYNLIISTIIHVWTSIIYVYMKICWRILNWCLSCPSRQVKFPIPKIETPDYLLVHFSWLSGFLLVQQRLVRAVHCGNLIVCNARKHLFDVLCRCKHWVQHFKLINRVLNAIQSRFFKI